MVDPEIVNEWLQKAEDDYGFACSVIEESPFYAQICFHFHQSAEKYLKALIIAYELEFKRIHDLAVLLKSSMLIDRELEALMEACTFLNPFYIDARYPVHWRTEYSKETAVEARDAVEQIRSQILPLICSSSTGVAKQTNRPTTSPTIKKQQNNFENPVQEKQNAPPTKT